MINRNFPPLHYHFKVISMLSVVLFGGCFGEQLTIKDIELAINDSVGKPFAKLSIDKLINETENYNEYETGLGNGCTWAVKVDKKTNLVESWRYTSDRKPCEEGVTRYSH